MKKFLSVILGLVICLSLCACGGNTDTLKVGDTTTTSVVEFTLTRFEYADKLKNAVFQTGKTPDPEYLLPTEEEQYNSPFVAKEGNVMISFSYTLKNIGKEKLTFPINLGITANYNDGYEFDAYVNLIKGEYVVLKDTTSLDPLSDICEGRGYIEVPIEVMENEDAPLLLKIDLPCDINSEKTTEVIYKIR